MRSSHGLPMQSASDRRFNDFDKIDSQAAFTVVTVYEDFETGKSAKKTYDYLVSHLGDQSEFNNRTWFSNMISMKIKTRMT